MDDSRIRMKQLKMRLERARSGALSALSLVLDLKDLKTGRYARQLSGWAMRVAEQMRLDDLELRQHEIASLLYDIGKIGVPDSILLKPGSLTAEEYSVVKKHPEYGWSILRSIPGFERASLLVLHHHERYDGSGYPAGLRADEIPLGSQIVAVVDALEAMLSDRPYRPRVPLAEVLERLAPEAGVQFHPEVLEQFVRIAGWIPPPEEVSGTRGGEATEMGGRWPRAAWSAGAPAIQI